MRQAWLLRDRLNPGRYEIATTIEHNERFVTEAEVVPWRYARRELGDESFVTMCRLSFSDWIANVGGL